jgi:hypothetical protein
VKTDSLVRVFPLLIAAVAAFPSAGTAAAPDCDSISGGAPILYGAGSTGARDLIGEMAWATENANSPLYVVYQSFGSCTGTDALTGVGPANITGTADYWDPDTKARTACNLPLAGKPVQFGVLDVRATNCPLVAGDESLLDGLTELFGPVDPVSVIVPVASTQQVISAEAFYLVYGLGADAGIEPWTSNDPAYFQRRNEDSGTQTMISLAAGIPSNKYIGTDAGGGSTLIANLAALANGEQGIGIATAGSADASRTSVRNLAWQGKGQDVGYWADSDASSFDKKNVRDGQYEVWANVVFYAKDGGSPGTFADPKVKIFADYFTGSVTPPGAPESMDEAATIKKLIPTCAMHVARDTDLGPIYAVTPAEPCDCYFDFTNTGATDCASCDDANPCASGTCRYGYCEVN